MDVGRVLSIMVVLGVALYLVQDYIGRWAWLLPILVGLAEPSLRKRRAMRLGKASPDGLDYGRRCTVVDVVPGALRVRLDDTIWAARSLDPEPLQVGELVYVHGGTGLVIHVARRKAT